MRENARNSSRALHLLAFALVTTLAITCEEPALAELQHNLCRGYSRATLSSKVRGRDYSRWEGEVDVKAVSLQLQAICQGSFQNITPQRSADCLCCVSQLTVYGCVSSPRVGVTRLDSRKRRQAID